MELILLLAGMDYLLAQTENCKFGPPTIKTLHQVWPPVHWFSVAGDIPVNSQYGVFVGGTKSTPILGIIRST